MFISLTYNNKNKNITYIAKPFEQTITKRFTGTKKTAEELSRKCIGAGCASTRPFYSNKGIESNSPKVAETLTNTAKQTPSNNKEPTPSINKTMDMGPLPHNFQVNPLTKQGENLVGNPYLDKLNRKLPLETEKKSQKEEPERARETTTSEEYSNNTTKYTADTEITDDLENPPAISPKIGGNNPEKIIQQESSDNLKKFEALFDTKNLHKDDPEIKELIKKLGDFDLIRIDEYGVNLVKKFYKILGTKERPQGSVYIGTLKNQQTVYEIYTLKIDKKVTLIASQIQKHAVISFKIDENQKLIIAYLTSDKTDLNKDPTKKELSSMQPFNPAANKIQIIQHLEQPVLICANFFINKLPEDLNKIGVTYINEVYLKLEEEIPRILNTIDKNKGFVSTYVGVGITKEEINYVIMKEEQNMKIQIKKDLVIYKQMQNQKTIEEISKWLTIKQQVYPLIYYKELEQTINEYEIEKKAKYEFKL